MLEKDSKQQSKLEVMWPRYQRTPPRYQRPGKQTSALQYGDTVTQILENTWKKLRKEVKPKTWDF